MPKTDLLSDLLTNLPSNLLSNFLSNLLTDLPSNLLSDFPSNFLTNLPSNLLWDGAVGSLEDDTPIYIYSTINIFCSSVELGELIKNYTDVPEDMEDSMENPTKDSPPQLLRHILVNIFFAFLTCKLLCISNILMLLCRIFQKIRWKIRQKIQWKI